MSNFMKAVKKFEMDTQTGCLTQNQNGSIVFGQCAPYDGPEQLTQLWYMQLRYIRTGPAVGRGKTVYFDDD